MDSRTRLVAVVAALLMAGMGGCESATDADLVTYDLELHADNLAVREADGVLLFTQEIEPGVAMDADYQGQVTADENGCMRLSSTGEYDVTAVWPMGYDLSRTGETLTVVNDKGTMVGELGDTFAFAGGEVMELTDAAGFTSADQALAAEQCPGRYWIVSP